MIFLLQIFLKYNSINSFGNLRLFSEVAQDVITTKQFL